MLIKLLISSLAVFLTSLMLGIGVATTSIQGFGWAIVTALVLGLINIFIKPIISIIFIPITFITLGLFSFVINGAMIYFAASLVPGFALPSFIMAIYFSIVLSIVNWVLNFFGRGDED